MSDVRLHSLHDFFEGDVVDPAAHIRMRVRSIADICYNKTRGDWNYNAIRVILVQLQEVRGFVESLEIRALLEADALLLVAYQIITAHPEDVRRIDVVAEARGLADALRGQLISMRDIAIDVRQHAEARYARYRQIANDIERVPIGRGA